MAEPTLNDLEARTGQPWRLGSLLAKANAQTQTAPDIRTALRANPRPLYHHPRRLLVVFSAKSACTSVVQWYLKLCGLLPAARFYHPWPHRYRVEVLYKSQRFETWLNHFNPADVRTVQFVRDPVKRCLSSYRHALRFGFADRKMSRALWRRVNHHKGFSLDFFLAYLEKTGVGPNADVHFRTQLHPIMGFVNIEKINVDDHDLFEELNRLESEMNLKPTDFANHPAFQRIVRRHVAPQRANRVADEATVLTREDARTEWPDLGSRIAPETVERIRRIYARDVAFIAGA